MASPQKENGYTAIANELMEALAGIRIPGVARQCLDVILRKTYGYNKKEDIISLSQFCLITKLSRSKVCHSLNKLKEINIIIAQKGNDIGNKYRFNKDFESWRPLPKRAIIAQKGNQPLPKRGHTKVDIYKNNNSVRKKMKQYQEETIDLDGNPIKGDSEKEALAGKTLMRDFKELVKTYNNWYKKEVQGNPPEFNWPTILKRYKEMLKLKHTHGRLLEYLPLYFEDKFYGNQMWSLRAFLSEGTLNKLKVLYEQ